MRKALLRSRQSEKALKFLSQSSQDRQLKTHHLKTMAQLAYGEGKWQLAANLLKRQTQAEPDKQYWQLLYAITLFELGDYKRAIKAFSVISDKAYKATSEHWINQTTYLMQ